MSLDSCGMERNAAESCRDGNGTGMVLKNKPSYCQISTDLDKILQIPIVVRNTLVG